MHVSKHSHTDLVAKMINSSATNPPYDPQQDAAAQAGENAPTPAQIARGVTAPDGSTKARIERAALELFAISGVDAVTTREIAVRAEVSEGAIYRHFAGKEALAQNLYDAINQMLTQMIRAQLTDFRDLETTVRAIVKGYCEIADRDWALFTYHLLSVHRFYLANREKLKQDDPAYATEEIIRLAIEREQMPAVDPALTAAMALGIVLQTALHKDFGRLDSPLTTLQQQLGDAVLRVLNPLNQAPA